MTSLLMLASAITYGSEDWDRVVISELTSKHLDFDGIVATDIRATLKMYLDGGTRVHGEFKAMGGYGRLSVLRWRGNVEADIEIDEVHTDKLPFEEFPKVPGRIGRLSIRLRDDDLTGWTEGIRIRGDPIRSVKIKGDFDTGYYKIVVSFFPDDGVVEVEGQLAQFFRKMRANPQLPKER